MEDHDVLSALIRHPAALYHQKQSSNRSMPAAGRLTHAAASRCNSIHPKFRQLLLNVPSSSIFQLPAVKLRCAAISIRRPPSSNPQGELLNRLFLLN